MQYFPLFLLMLAGLVLITRPLTVLFHELGHAIPMILMTRQKAIIYIGSYGDPKSSFKINLGILVIFFRYDPLAWKLGLCMPSAKVNSINKQIVYILCGPLASLLIAVIGCYLAFAYDLHGFLKLFLVVFTGSAFIDLIVNLIPNHTAIKLYNGNTTYNDGYSLKLLFYYKRLPKEYFEAAELFNKQQYADAAQLFEKILRVRRKDDAIYRLTIDCYLQDKNYKKIKELSVSFLTTGKANSDDLSNIGVSYSQLGIHDEALKFYEKSLWQNPGNKYALNNKGYTLILQNKFEEAIALLDKSIQADPGFAYPYSNRGLAKIKSGSREEGLQDINHSIELDPGNAYGYRNLGVYHFDKGAFEEALPLFEKAKELDASTHMIDELIRDCKYYVLK